FDHTGLLTEEDGREMIRRIRSICCARAASGQAAAAPPSATSNSRRPMMTVIRPSRARCVKGTIPRHERAVLPARHPKLAKHTPGIAGASPAHDFCFSVAEDRARGSRPPRVAASHLLKFAV